MVSRGVIHMDDSQSWNQIFRLWQDNNIFEQDMYTCWLLWNNKNDCLHNMSRSLAFGLAMKAARMKEKFNDPLVRHGRET